MRRQHSSSPAKWTQEFRQAIRLGYEHFTVYACLEGGPQSDMTGIYVLMLPALAGYVRMDVSRVEEIMRDLTEAGLILWDSENELVWIPCVMEEQHQWHCEEKALRDNRYKSVQNYIAKLPDCALYKQFLGEWQIFSPSKQGGQGNE